MALSNVDVHAVVEQFQFRHHPHLARGLFVPNQLLRRLDGHHLDALCRVGRVLSLQRHRSVVRLCCTCWWYSLCNVQYRPMNIQDHVDCCMYTRMYFFYVYIDV